MSQHSQNAGNGQPPSGSAPRRITHLEQNVAAAGIKLSPEELKALGELLAAEKFSGKRYGDSGAWVAKR